MIKKLFYHPKIESFFSVTFSASNSVHKLNGTKIYILRQNKYRSSTHFLGTVLTYGMTTLSTNEPNPSLKSDVMLRMLSTSSVPRLESLSLSSSIDFERSIK